MCSQLLDSGSKELSHRLPTKKTNNLFFGLTCKARCSKTGCSISPWSPERVGLHAADRPSTPPLPLSAAPGHLSQGLLHHFLLQLCVCVCVCVCGYRRSPSLTIRIVHSLVFTNTHTLPVRPLVYILVSHKLSSPPFVSHISCTNSLSQALL